MVFNPTNDTELSRIYAHYKNDIHTIQQLHEGLDKSHNILRELTATTDTLVIRVLLEYLQRILNTDELPKNMLLLAQGGYGRRELHPKSDIDLLFLYTGTLTDELGEVVRKVFQTLFDMGFVVGHSCRGFKEALDIANNDHQSQSAMMETRFLAGDWQLFETFKYDLWRTLSRKRREHIRTKIKERHTRRNQYGITINITEPHIKESPGGLRDYHFGLWIASLFVGRTMNLLHLKRTFLIDDVLYHKMEEALEFLWRLRNDLHFMTGKEQDVLAMPLQHEVSTRLGYQDQRGRLSEEDMMRDYYMHALTIDHFSEHMIKRCTPKPFWSNLKPKSRKSLSDGLFIQNNQLYIPQDLHYFELNPTRILKTFLVAAEHKVEISNDARITITENLYLIDQAFLYDKTNAQLVRRFFSISRSVEPVVRIMRQTGFLEHLFPEWRSIAHLVRYDLVHRYTVDEHSLLTLYHLEHLYHDDLKYAQERQDIWMGCSDKDILRLSAMFHDIGKGRNGDHSIIGADLVSDIGRRMRLSDRKRKTLVFLVRNHLIMSYTAQRRDLTDPQVTADFCDLIEDLETLNMLYVLTFVDMRSVSPESMTEWKNNLLWQLYTSARQFFISDASEQADSNAKLSRKEHVTQKLSTSHDRQFILNHLNALPPSYLMYQSSDQIKHHLDALAEFDGNKPVVTFHTCMDEECLDMVLVWNDRVGLLNKICTAVMLENFSINEARLNTRQDGIIVDNFLIRDSLNEGEAISESRQQLLQDRLERMLRSNDPPPCIPKAPAQQWVGRNRIKNKVRILNDITMRYTILEIGCTDRRGLLQNLTSVLYNMNISIHFARIITEGNRVTDIFYISDANGDKITDSEILDNLKEELQGQIEPAVQNA